MAKTLPLKTMTLQEKLAAMESLWTDITGSAKPIKSPSWHKRILSERRMRIANGKARFIDWDTAKAEIRKKLE
jgi:Putative addiction module component